MLKKKGFTLIELLIVMVIMAILVAIVIGLIGQSATNRAKDVDAKAAMREVQTALEMNKADTNEYPTANGAAVTVLATPLVGYVDVTSVLACDSCDLINYVGSADEYDLIYNQLANSEDYIIENKQ